MSGGETERLRALIAADDGLMRLLTVLRAQDLPQGWLVSGAIYQTVWNVLTGCPRGRGIRDYDIAYFDDADLSWEAEDAVIRRMAAAVTGCPGPVEVRNQARVHLWFGQKFGVACEPLRSTEDGLTRYAAPAHAVGVRLTQDGHLDILAPFGLADIFALRLRHNPTTATGKATFLEKALRMQKLWPELSVET